MSPPYAQPGVIAGSKVEYQSVMVHTLRTKAFFLLLALVASGLRTFALDASLDVSQYAHTTWKIREGFTKGTIFSMAQTSDGYLWLGTEFGLVRFDGVQAIPWKPPAGEALPSNYIRDLLVTRDGTLWIGTLKGLASWKDGKLTGYPQVAGHAVGPLLEDGHGVVWVAVQEPGSLCEIRAATIKCNESRTFGRSVIALYEDHRGNLWLSAQTGLWRWAPGPPQHYSFASEGIDAQAMLENDDGAILMATGVSSAPASLITSAIEAGLKQLVGGKIRRYEFSRTAGEFRPTRLFRSSDGSLWVGTVQGLIHMHQGQIDRFDTLSGDVVTNIFEDREGTVWVATQDGLDRFRDFAVPTMSVNEGLSNSAVHVLQATPDGSIWIATADGLNRWQNGHFTVYGEQNVPGQSRAIREGELTIKARVTEIANSGLRNSVYSLGEDDRGRLWAGTRDGVFYFDHSRFLNVPGIPAGNMFAIAGDDRGKVWVSNLEHGLFYSAPDHAVQRIPWDQIGHKDAAVALLPDRVKGGVWLGFSGGGIAYLQDGHIRSSYDVADGLGKGAVMDLELGSDGAVWAATEGGLSRVRDGRITTLTSKNGLPCDAVYWVIEDNDRSLWLNMPCGLTRILRPELDAWVSDANRSVPTTLFDSSDGVRVRAFAGRYSRKVTKSLDGKILFAPQDGVSIIDPRHLAFNKLPPPVHIEQVIADGTTYSSTGALQLPPRVRDLSIDYTALSLVAPDKIRFRYRLDGQDREWREVVNNRQVQYSNLGPGHYTFRVTAANNSGVWNEAGTSLDFSIAPAYYQTSWFRFSCAAVLLLILWGLYRLRVRELAYRFNLRLEERVGERTRIARDLHDTLLQSFHGLLLRFQMVSNQLPAGEVKQNLDDAIDQAAQAVTEGRDAVQGLRASTIDTNDLAMAIRAMGEELAPPAADQSALEFSVQVEGSPRTLHPIIRDEVYRIAGEALRNAFKHAHARQIEVEIHYDDRQFRLHVRDDGKGMDPKVLSEEGRAGHYGLRGMRERAKLMGAKLAVWSEKDSGTEVELKVPVSTAYEKSVIRRSWLSELADKLSSKDTAMKS